MMQEMGSRFIEKNKAATLLGLQPYLFFAFDL